MLIRQNTEGPLPIPQKLPSQKQSKNKYINSQSVYCRYVVMFVALQYKTINKHKKNKNRRKKL
jgi:hypothetical protein